MLGSFKIKLVGTFLALSVVPLAAAFWGFSAVAERSVTSSVDGRLEAGLNAALAAFEDERQSAAAAVYWGVRSLASRAPQSASTCWPRRYTRGSPCRT